MIRPLAILGMYVVAWIFELQHDNIHRLVRNNLRQLIRKVSNLSGQVVDFTQETEWSVSWHSWDWRHHAWMALMITGLQLSWSQNLTDLLLLPAIACERMIILNIGQAIKSENRKWYELGEGWIDQLLWKWFGSWWPLAVVTVFLACISAMIIWV